MSKGEQLWELAAEAASGLGLELDDVELLGQGARTILRVTIDRPGDESISLDDCTAMSRDFSALLDVEDPLQGRYTLEVSSPGLDRPLKALRHYEKNIGKLVKIVLKEKQDGQGFFLGRLTGANNKIVVLDVRGEAVTIAMDNVKRARLEVEI